MTDLTSSAAASRSIVQHAQNRIYVLEEEIKVKQEEISIMKAIIKKMKPCKDCKGEGSIRMMVAQDETETRECKTCKGKGFKD